MSRIDDGDNYETFRDCLSVSAVARLSSASTKGSNKRSGRKRRNSRKLASTIPSIVKVEEDDLSELSEFVDVRQSDNLLWYTS